MRGSGCQWEHHRPQIKALKAQSQWKGLGTNIHQWEWTRICQLEGWKSENQPHPRMKLLKECVFLNHSQMDCHQLNSILVHICPLVKMQLRIQLIATSSDSEQHVSLHNNRDLACGTSACPNKLMRLTDTKRNKSVYIHVLNRNTQPFLNAWSWAICHP